MSNGTPATTGHMYDITSATTGRHIQQYNGDNWPQCHKTFEYSQEISEPENRGAENFLSLYKLKSKNVIKIEDISNSTIL
jgi:hypothetical protein